MDPATSHNGVCIQLLKEQTWINQHCSVGLQGRDNTTETAMKDKPLHWTIKRVVQDIQIYIFFKLTVYFNTNTFVDKCFFRPATPNPTTVFRQRLAERSYRPASSVTCRN